MVRTRNTRNNSGGGGGGARDNSASFKPLTSGAKKGRKRQLTDTASSSVTESSSSSALVPGSGSSTALALLGPGTSHHGHRQQPGHDPGADHGDDLEEGYLAPQAPAAASFNNNPAANIQVAAWLEDSPETDPELMERTESPLSTEDTEIVHSAASALVMHAPSAHAPSAASLTPGLVSVASGGHQALEVGLVTSSRVTLLPEDLKSNLECPVCARISLPPIMQCRNGHVTCNPCRLKVQSCPMCREIDIDIRWGMMRLV